MITALHQVFGRKYKVPIANDYILAYDFDGNVIDKSNSLNHGINTGVTFAIGKNGKQCAVFNGSAKIESTNKVVVNSNKITVSFWFQKDVNSTGYLFKFGSNDSTTKGFVFLIDYPSINQLLLSEYSGLYKEKKVDYTSGWRHIVIVIDRSLPATEQQKIYIDNVYQGLGSLFKMLPNNYLDNFISIGQSVKGRIQYLRIYNRDLTPIEITNLYNE